MLNAVEDNLATLRALLEVPRTALAIGRELKCSKPTAYNRLDVLRSRGVVLKYKLVREGKSGPRSRAFYIAAG